MGKEGNPDAFRKQKKMSLPSSFPDRADCGGRRDGRQRKRPWKDPHSPQQQAAVPLGRVPYKGSVLRQSGVEQEKKQKAPPATARAAWGGQSECCITEISLFVSFRSLFYPLSHRVDGETTVFTIYVDFLSKITVTWP